MEPDQALDYFELITPMTNSVQPKPNGGRDTPHRVRLPDRTWRFGHELYMNKS